MIAYSRPIHTNQKTSVYTLRE